jgi:hypothetical protein
MSKAPVPFGETPQAAKARRMRSWAIALSLAVFVILVFVVTITRLGGNVANAPY